ncbi:hypothetical protein L484_001223 [Morus notabilis]|uniref:Uncharacterized protein n=1 Tax=Morus notabilis TaxID=981085 RepID=W9SNY2_9ROSA|nr:hypothetical protein L484_001223 [Morus notabilis]
MTSPRQTRLETTHLLDPTVVLLNLAEIAAKCHHKSATNQFCVPLSAMSHHSKPLQLLQRVPTMMKTSPDPTIAEPAKTSTSPSFLRPTTSAKNIPT